MSKSKKLKHLIRNADGSIPEPLVDPNWRKKPGLIPTLLTTIALGIGGIIGSKTIAEEHQAAKIQAAQKDAQIADYALQLKRKLAATHADLRAKPLAEFREKRNELQALINEYDKLTTSDDYVRLERSGQINLRRNSNSSNTNYAFNHQYPADADRHVKFLKINLARLEQIKQTKPLLQIPQTQLEKAMKGTQGREDKAHEDLPFLITKRKLAAKVEKKVTVNGRAKLQTFLAPSQQELELMYKVLRMYSNPKATGYDPIKSLHAVQAVRRVLKTGGYQLSRLPDEKSLTPEQKQNPNAVSYERFTTQLEQTWRAVREHYLNAIQNSGIESATPLPGGALQIKFHLPIPTRGYWVTNYKEAPQLAATAINLHVINGVSSVIKVPAANTRQITIHPHMLQDPRSDIPAMAVFTFTHDLSTGAPEDLTTGEPGDLTTRFILNKDGKLEPFNKQLQPGQIIPNNPLDPITQAFSTPTQAEKEELLLNYYPKVNTASKLPAGTKGALFDQKDAPFSYLEEQPDGKKVWKKTKIKQNKVRDEYTFNQWSSQDAQDAHIAQKTQMIEKAIREVRKNYPVLTVRDGQVVLLGLRNEPKQETVKLEPIEITPEEETTQPEPTETQPPSLIEEEDTPIEPPAPATKHPDEPPTGGQQGMLNLEKAHEWKNAAQKRKTRKIT